MNSYLQFNSVLLASVRKVDNVARYFPEAQLGRFAAPPHRNDIETFTAFQPNWIHRLSSFVRVSAKLHHFIQLDEQVRIIMDKIKHEAGCVRACAHVTSWLIITSDAK